MFKLMTTLKEISAIKHNDFEIFIFPTLVHLGSYCAFNVYTMKRKVVRFDKERNNIY